ncbi:MAG TPA: TMEM175 family protein [Mycobacteriales bacterium]|nr:TMEM175 family protein [Mycobacteriales bacterium]
MGRGNRRRDSARDGARATAREGGRAGAWYARGWRFRPADHAPHAWGRLGAFVDGVYAIASTLLVLELRPPESVPPGELGHELAGLGPAYAAYAIGFLQMVTGWLQTRRLDAWMRGIDHYATLLVLISVGLYALTPFSTAVLAHAFGNEEDLATAVRLSAGILFVAVLAFAALLVYTRSAGLLRSDVDADAVTLYLRNGVLVPVVPAVAFAVSYVAPWAGLGLLVGLNLLGLLPLEAHRPPVGVERGPRSTIRLRRSAAR